jgi:hypothetical protein
VLAIFINLTILFTRYIAGLDQKDKNMYETERSARAVAVTAEQREREEWTVNKGQGSSLLLVLTYVEP